MCLEYQYWMAFPSLRGIGGLVFTSLESAENTAKEIGQDEEHVQLMMANLHLVDLKNLEDVGMAWKINDRGDFLSESEDQFLGGIRISLRNQKAQEIKDKRLGC